MFHQTPPGFVFHRSFPGKFGLSFGLMLMEDIGLSILWLKDDLPLIQAFDLMCLDDC